jgi:Zn-dependent protease with chaperone function
MGMDRFEGLYYDGQSSRAIPVVVMPLQNDQLLLRGEQLELCQPLGQLRWEQPPGRSRPRLHWPGGGLVEVNDDGQLAALFAGRPGGRLQGLLRWAESHRAGAVGASLLAIGTIAAVLVTGLPLLAAGVSAAIPAAVERQLGEAVLASLDKQSFAPSQLPRAKQQQVRNLVQRIEATAPEGRRLRLELRDSRTIGANALCLPGDILVVTDALVRLASEEELLAVLAHEAGHARHRHPLQMMVRGHALTLATGLIGGHDNPIQGVTEGLVGNAYSRAFEHQADREALAVLRRLNLTPTPFFSILDKLERQQGKTDAPSFLLTHPSNRERRARASGT